MPFPFIRVIDISPFASFNSLPTIINSLKKHKSLYKVLTPSIKPPHINSYGLMGAHDTIWRHWAVKS